MPDETRNYVKTITGQPIEKWTEKTEIEVASHLPARAPCEGVLKLSRVASAERIPVQMTPAIAKIIEEAKERVAKAKAVQLAKKEKKEKAKAARLAKLKKGKDDKTRSADNDSDSKGKKRADNAADQPKLAVANAE